MAKKRRSTTTTTAKTPGPRGLNPEDAKVAAFNTWEDIPDEEDEFHITRDKVLLEGESVGHGRRRGYGDDESDEEVLALEDYGAASSDSEEEQEEAAAPKGKSKAKASKNDDSDSDAAPTDDDDDEDAEGWGTSKKDYYGGDTIATEQDAALEAAEALRLQAKHAAALHEADYGFDEAEWATTTSTTPKNLVVGQGRVVTESLPPPGTIAEGLSPEERARQLEARHPELRPLAEEFASLQALHAPLGLSAAAAEAVGETVRSSVAVVKFRALSAYLGVLSMYFAVLSGPATAAEGVREHGVMEGLLRCRRMWEAVEGLEVEEIRSEGAAGGEGAKVKVGGKGEPKRKRAKLSPEFTDSDSDADSDAAPAAATRSSTKKSAKSKSSSTKKPKKPLPTTDLSDLTALATSFRPTTTTTTTTSTTPKPTPKPAPTTRTTASAHDTTDFGDDSTLAALDAEQKAARRRNLRFYTSQIVSKSAKRGAAGQSAGGDTDLPHRERRKEKELRLAAEAARRRRNDDDDGADGLSDGDPDERDLAVARQVRGEVQEEGSDNEYYDMLAGRARQKKERERAWHEAERVGGVVKEVEVEVEEGKGGKRAVGYVIEKNKGLTPHRKKEVRNPRVKKRLRYEAAKKKLGSRKAVYKGGLQGSYGGEATGIKKNLVKSTKFK